MTTNAKETLMDWLRDAHAMETAGASLLERQAALLKDQPTIQGKINEHLTVTREQRDRLKALIERMGGDVSKVKAGAGSLMANAQALMGAMAPDSVVKNSLGNYAVEHFEIACYTSLIAAAEAQSQPEVARVCKEILEQEREMANWLEHHIPRITNEYLGKKEAAR